MVANVKLSRFLLFSHAELQRCQGAVLGKWRFVLDDLNSEVRFEASDWEPNVGLERLHLLTVVRGLEELDQRSDVTLFTTGRNVVHGVHFGLAQWRKNQWRWERFDEMVPIADQDLWQRFDRASQIHRVSCRTAHRNPLGQMLIPGESWRAGQSADASATRFGNRIAERLDQAIWREDQQAVRRPDPRVRPSLRSKAKSLARRLAKVAARSHCLIECVIHCVGCRSPWRPL